MPHGTEWLQIWNVLYVPEANKQLFLLIAMGQHGGMSQTMKEGKTAYQNGTPFILAHQNRENYILSIWYILAKTWEEVPRAIIAILSDYTLWHRRMGHPHQCVIKHLRKNMEGGPHQTTEAPHRACEGCKKGKSKRPSFPTSRSREKWPLDLVHSHLDKMPVLSIGGYKYTTTYLDNYFSFGVMFYLKHKKRNLPHSKPTRLGPKENLAPHWNAGDQIMGESSCQRNKKLIWQRTKLNFKHPCKTLHNKMDKQKGSSKPS